MSTLQDFYTLRTSVSRFCTFLSHSLLSNDAKQQKFEAHRTAELSASVWLSNFLKCTTGFTFSTPKSLPEHSNFSDSPELLWSKICSWRVGCCFLLAATPATPSGSSNAMYSFCINSRCCWTSCFWLEMKASKCISARAYALQWNEALARTSYKKSKDWERRSGAEDNKHYSASHEERLIAQLICFRTKQPSSRNLFFNTNWCTTKRKQTKNKEQETGKRKVSKTLRSFKKWRRDKEKYDWLIKGKKSCCTCGMQSEHLRAVVCQTTQWN